MFMGAKNLPGVEIVTRGEAERRRRWPLAETPGRLTVFSESALKKVGEW